MKVVRARCAGACYGVQRALDLARETADGREVATLGPLIHNPQVVSQLAEQGVRVVEDASEVDTGTVVIRSHGVTPAVRRAVEERGLEIVDATCPHVARAQKAAAELARACGTVIVVGEAGHPEVEGLEAWARESGGTVFVVGSPDDLPRDLSEPAGVVVQTTQERSALEAVVARLEERGASPVVRNTICFATRQRQDAAAELAGAVDAIVVIGGRNSSNTTRLAAICSQSCAKTFHIEAPGELDPQWFAGCATVGVTAGASTPEDQIDAVVAYLEEL